MVAVVVLLSGVGGGVCAAPALPHRVRVSGRARGERALVGGC